MEQLIIGETDRGTYYVRPMSWAGIWDKVDSLDWKKGIIVYIEADVG